MVFFQEAEDDMETYDRKLKVPPVVLGPAASASPSSLLEKEILRPHPRPVESEVQRTLVGCGWRVKWP